MDRLARLRSLCCSLSLVAFACGGETASEANGQQSVAGAGGGAANPAGAAGMSPLPGGAGGGKSGVAGSGTSGTAGAAGSSIAGAGGSTSTGGGGSASGGAAGAGSGGTAAGGSNASGAGGAETAGSGGLGQSGAAGSGTAGAPAAPIEGPKVKVCSFNIRVGTSDQGTPNAWDKRKSQVFQLLQDTDADFVGMQEDLAFQLEEIDAKIPAYDRIGVGAQDGKGAGEHVALYYLKGRFELLKHDTFWLSETPNKPGSISWGNDDLPRVVTWARFKEKSSGYGFYVYNTHFDHRANPSRGKGARLVSQHMKDRERPDEPVILMGDLNMQDDAPPFRYLEGKAQLEGKDNPVPLFDTFRALHPDEKNARTAHGFDGGVVGSPIDFILLSKKDGEAKQAWINHDNQNGLYPSDHYPIFANLKLVDKK